MKFILYVLVFFCFIPDYSSQCNTDVSICTSGEAGPFTFVNASSQVGTCQGFINGLNSPNYGYILLNITESGPLSLLIDGTSNTGYIDVSIFNIPSGVDPCVAITDNSNEIGCNYASNSSGCNQFGTFFSCPSTVPSPSVSAGDVVMIVVEDYSSSQSSFTLELGPAPNAQTGLIDAEIFPIPDMITSDSPFQISALVGGGTWSADCGSCIDTNTGFFDPEIAGVGTWEVCYTVGQAPCDDSDCSEVTVDPAVGGCGDTSTDSGGILGNYSNNESLTYSFCSDDLTQTVNLVFSEFDLDVTDLLNIYEGPDDSYPLIGSYTGSINPSIIISTNGCLTVVFTSDASSTGAGWEAEFDCVPDCQDFEVEVLDTTFPLDGPNGEIQICQGQPVEFTAGGIFPNNNTGYFQSTGTSTFEWNFGNGNIEYGETAVYTFTDAGIYLVELTATDMLDCISSNVFELVIHVSTTPIFSGTNAEFDEICLGAQNVLTGLSFATSIELDNLQFEPVIITEFWQTDPDIVSVLGNSITVQPTSIGSHCYTYVTEDNFGCAYDTTICFDVVALENPSFTLQSYCFDSPNQATINGVSGGEFTFFPEPDDDAIIDIETGEISFGEAGATYTVLYTTLGSCSNSETQSVTVLSLDNSSFTCENYCVGTVPGPGFTDVPGGTFVFNPSPLDGSVIDAITGVITNGVGGTTYFIEYTTVGVCPSSEIQTATVYEEINVVNIVETCELNQIEYTVSFTIDGGDNSNYNVEGAGTLTGNTFVSDFIPSDTNYSFLVTDQNTCNEVVIEGTNICFCLATASLSGDIEFCENETGTLEIQFDGDAPWEFDYAIDGVFQSTVSTTDAVFSFPVSEEGLFSLENVSDVNCLGSVSGIGNVAVIELPTATTSGNYEICSNETQSISIDVTGDSNWEVFYSIDGIMQSSITGNQSPLTFIGFEEGDYEIISVEDNNCLTTGNGITTINYFSPISIDLSIDESICIGDQILISGMASGETNTDFNYSWLVNGVAFSQLPTDLIAPDISSTYVLEVFSSCNIMFSDSLSVAVHPYPVVSFESSKTVLCEGDAELIITNTTDPVYNGNCSWDINGDVVQSCEVLNYNFADVGSYDVGLTVTSPFGCSTSFLNANFITVNPSPVALFEMTPDKPTVFNNTIDFINQSVGAINYQWDFSGLGNSSTENPSFEFNAIRNDFLVCLEVSNIFSCIDEVCKELILDEELIIYVPNAFSPNNDLINDFFKPIISGGDALVYEFSIYDRWGEKIFYTEDISRGWSGRRTDEINNSGDDYYAIDGLYNWTIVIKKDNESEKHELAGSVIVFR